MCRATPNGGDSPYLATDRGRLRIRSFHLLLSLTARRRPPPPDVLTLIYLPRFSGTSLEINDAKIREDAPAFVALHRVRSAETADGSEVAFVSTDRIRTGQGVSFAVYAEGRKVLQGFFRRGLRWVVDCRCAEETDSAAIGVAAVELCVVTDSGVVIRERVLMKAARQRQRHVRFCSNLQEIPEEKEVDVCCYDEEEEEDEKREMVELDSWGWVEGKAMEGGDGLEMKGISWAVDVGILVACLGVGLLVSRVSSKRFIKLIY